MLANTDKAPFRNKQGKLLLPGIDMRRFQVQDKQLVKLFSRVFNASVS